MHMHCHNSRNPDFDFIAPSEERLKYIEENYDRIIEITDMDHYKLLAGADLLITDYSTQRYGFR